MRIKMLNEGISAQFFYEPKTALKKSVLSPSLLETHTEIAIDKVLSTLGYALKYYVRGKWVGV